MNFTEVLQAITATLVAASVIGIVKLYGQVKEIIARLDGHEDLDTSRFTSLHEVLAQIRLEVAALAKKKRR